MTTSPPSTAEHSRLTRGHLLVLLAIVLTAVNLRTSVTGFSAVVDEIGADIGFGAATVGGVGTAVTACFAVFGFAAPFVTRRVGLEWTAALALALTTVGVVLRAAADSATGILLSTVVAFAGVGLSNVIVIPIVKQYFPDRIAALSTTYLVLLQVGQFAAPLIAVPLALTAGWHIAVGVWAVPLGVAAVLWFVVARTRRSEAFVVSGAAPSRATSWGLVLLFGATSLHVYTLITWLPTIFADAGIPIAAGAVLLALFSSLGLVAAFVVPASVSRMRDPFVIVVACVVLLAIGYLGLLLAPAAGAVVWAIALGLGVSTFPLCMTLVTVRARDAAHASAVSGRMQGCGYSIACIGPVLIGVVTEATGGWMIALSLLLISLVATLASGWSATRPARTV